MPGYDRITPDLYGPGDVSDMIDWDGPVPRYQQLAAILRAQIESGQLPPDRPITSKRTLGEMYGLGPHTVQKAVALLVAEGLVTYVHGKGFYVTR